MYEHIIGIAVLTNCRYILSPYSYSGDSRKWLRGLNVNLMSRQQLTLADMKRIWNIPGASQQLATI